jgi:hypothetical protein
MDTPKTSQTPKEQTLYFEDNGIRVTQEELQIGEDHYAIADIQFAKMIEKFNGFSYKGWIFVAFGVPLSIFYGAGLLLIMAAFVWFAKSKYAIEIIINTEEKIVFTHTDGKYVKQITDALKASMAKTVYS